MNDVKLSNGYTPGLVGRLTELHATYYDRIWEVGPQFESDIAEGIAEFVRRYDPSRDGIWTVVDEDGIIRGGIIIDGRKVSEEEAQLRYFILASDLHGEGFGRKLLERAVAFCDTREYDRVFLWTIGDLEAAIHLYRDVGFTPTEHVDVHTGWQTDVPYRLFERRRSKNNGAYTHGVRQGFPMIGGKYVR